MNLAKTDLGNFEHQNDPGEQPYGVKRRSVTEQDAIHLAEIFRGKIVLEIGTGLGVSTKAIASTADRVYTCDPDPWVEKEIVPSLPGNVVFSKEPSKIRTEAAFIDGCHTLEDTKRDIVYALEHSDCNPLVVHDSYINEVGFALAQSNLSIVEDYGPPCHMVRVVMT